MREMQRQRRTDLRNEDEKKKIDEKYKLASNYQKMKRTVRIMSMRTDKTK